MNDESSFRETLRFIPNLFARKFDGKLTIDPLNRNSWKNPREIIL